MTLYSRGIRQALILLGLAGGCSLIGPDCINETRGVVLEGSSADGVRFYVDFHEERNHSSQRIVQRRISWAVIGNIGDDIIIGIRLRTTATGPILANFPISAVRPGVLAEGDVFEPAFLTESYDDTFGIATTEPVYGELVTEQFPGARSQARLPIKFDNPWYHAYCS